MSQEEEFSFFRNIGELEETQSHIAHLLDTLDKDNQTKEANEVEDLIISMEDLLGSFSEHQYELQHEIKDLLDSSRHGLLTHDKLSQMITNEQVRTNYLVSILGSLKSQVECLFSVIVRATDEESGVTGDEMVEYVQNNMGLMMKSLDSMAKIVVSPNKKLTHTIQKMDSDVVVHMHQALQNGSFGPGFNINLALPTYDNPTHVAPMRQKGLSFLSQASEDDTTETRYRGRSYSHLSYRSDADSVVSDDDSYDPFPDAMMREPKSKSISPKPKKSPSVERKINLKSALKSTPANSIQPVLEEPLIEDAENENFSKSEIETQTESLTKNETENKTENETENENEDQLNWTNEEKEAQKQSSKGKKVKHKVPKRSKDKRHVTMHVPDSQSEFNHSTTSKSTVGRAVSPKRSGNSPRRTGNSPRKSPVPSKSTTGVESKSSDDSSETKIKNSLKLDIPKREDEHSTEEKHEPLYGKTKEEMEEIHQLNKSLDDKLKRLALKESLINQRSQEIDSEVSRRVEAALKVARAASFVASNPPTSINSRSSTPHGKDRPVLKNQFSSSNSINSANSNENTKNEQNQVFFPASEPNSLELDTGNVSKTNAQDMDTTLKEISELSKNEFSGQPKVATISRNENSTSKSVGSLDLSHNDQDPDNDSLFDDSVALEHAPAPVIHISHSKLIEGSEMSGTYTMQVSDEEKKRRWREEWEREMLMKSLSPGRNQTNTENQNQSVIYLQQISNLNSKQEKSRFLHIVAPWANGRSDKCCGTDNSHIMSDSAPYTPPGTAGLKLGSVVDKGITSIELKPGSAIINRSISSAENDFKMSPHRKKHKNFKSNFQDKFLNSSVSLDSDTISFFPEGQGSILDAYKNKSKQSIGKQLPLYDSQHNLLFTRTYKEQKDMESFLNILQNSENPLLDIYKEYGPLLSDIQQSRLLNASTFDSEIRTQLFPTSTSTVQLLKHMDEHSEKMMKQCGKMAVLVSECESISNSVISVVKASGKEAAQFISLRDQLSEMHKKFGQIEAIKIPLDMQIIEYRILFEDIQRQGLNRLKNLITEFPSLNDSYQKFLMSQGKSVEMVQRILACKERCKRYNLLNLSPENVNNIISSGHDHIHPVSTMEQLKVFNQYEAEIHQLKVRNQMLENDIQDAEEEIQDLEMELQETMKSKDKTPPAILFFSLMHDPSFVPSLQQICLQMSKLKNFASGEEHIDFVTLRKRIQVCLVCTPSIDKLVSKYKQMYKQWSFYRLNWFSERNVIGGSADSFSSCPLCYHDLLINNNNVKNDNNNNNNMEEKTKKHEKHKMRKEKNAGLLKERKMLLSKVEESTKEIEKNMGKDKRRNAAILKLPDL